MRISADKINWRIALGELSLIVIGILMALAIDSYAERRADREQAATYLSDLVTELQVDKSYFENSHRRVGMLIDSATRLLRLVEGKDKNAGDPGGLLLGALFGEGTTRESAIWEEIQMTGALRLIPDPEIRIAIVGYYLDRASRLKTIDENFVPAVRDLRSLAWDVMPVESFAQYMQPRQSGSGARTGVPGTTVMTRLQSRDDTVYLLKRLIVTGTVARLNLKSTSEKTTELIATLTD